MDKSIENSLLKTAFNEVDKNNPTNDQSNEAEKTVCVVVAGSVDAGKSSFLGVLTSGELDDGKGSARAKVAKHPHEIREGKTSDISTKTINNGNKELTLVDLCGHEKYLKTTVFGVTGYFPDYGVVIVAANRGLLKMTKEHMGILLYMKVPFIIVITRVDITPKNIYDGVVDMTTKMLKKYKRQVDPINVVDDFDIINKPEKFKELEKGAYPKINDAIKKIKNNHYYVPMITISNKSGFYIDPARSLLTGLEPRKVWDINDMKGSIFYIDSKFSPLGIGLVVSGLTKGLDIGVNSELLIGPYNKDFRRIKVWSLHDNDKNPVKELKDRQRGCLAIKGLDKKEEVSKANIRKGMIVVTKGLENNICYQFKATITILSHSTMISPKYTPVIHCGVVRQAARIILNENQALKMGDEAEVSFRFTQFPEFIGNGSIFFFREGTTKGCGTITEILPVKDDENQDPAEPKRVKQHRARRHHHKNNKGDGGPKIIKKNKKLNIEVI